MSILFGHFCCVRDIFFVIGISHNLKKMWPFLLTHLSWLLITFLHVHLEVELFKKFIFWRHSHSYQCQFQGYCFYTPLQRNLNLRNHLKQAVICICFWQEEAFDQNWGFCSKLLREGLNSANSMQSIFIWNSVKPKMQSFGPSVLEPACGKTQQTRRLHPMTPSDRTGACMVMYTGQLWYTLQDSCNLFEWT